MILRKTSEQLNSFQNRIKFVFAFLSNSRFVYHILVLKTGGPLLSLYPIIASLTAPSPNPTSPRHQIQLHNKRKIDPDNQDHTQRHPCAVHGAE